MAILPPEVQKAVENIETFKKLIRGRVTSSNNNLNLLSLVETYEERLMLAPSSTRTEYHGAYPGGLVEHSLNVVKLMAALNKSYEAELTPESIVISGLFHDIGKIGTMDKDYYLPKSSDWHQKQGIRYEVNPELATLPTSLRSLYLLQHNNIVLTLDEYTAISSIRDRSRPGEESLPVGNEPMLAVVLSQAVRVSCLRGRGRTSLLLG